MVDMCDGVRLATDVYLAKCDEPFPSILTRLLGEAQQVLAVLRWVVPEDRLSPPVWP